MAGIRANLGRLAPTWEATTLFGHGVMVELNAALAQTCLELVLAEHDAGVDPDGVPWAQNESWKWKIGAGGLQPLMLTGKMRDSWVPFSGTQTFGVMNPVEYARVQDRGGTVGRGVVLPARPLVPKGALSPAWEAALSATAQRVLEDRIPLDIGGSLSSPAWFL